MSRARSGTGVSAHSGQASCAVRAARSTSAPPERGTRASASPVAGSRTSSASSVSAATRRPPITLSSSSVLAVVDPMPRLRVEEVEPARRYEEVDLLTLARAGTSPDAGDEEAALALCLLLCRLDRL